MRGNSHEKKETDLKNKKQNNYHDKKKKIGPFQFLMTCFWIIVRRKWCVKYSL